MALDLSYDPNWEPKVEGFADRAKRGLGDLGLELKGFADRAKRGLGDLGLELNAGTTVDVPQWIIGANDLLAKTSPLGRAAEVAIPDAVKNWRNSATDAARASLEARGQRLQSEMSPEQQASDKKDILSDQMSWENLSKDGWMSVPGKVADLVSRGEVLGVGLSDWRKVTGAAARSFPSSILSMFPAFKAASIAGEAASAASLAKAGLTAAATSAEKEAALAVAQKAALHASERAAMLTGGLSEGVQGAGAANEQTRQAVMQLPIETLRKSPYFQEAVKTAGGDEVLARRNAADAAASSSAAGAFVVDALFGALGDKFIGTAAAGHGSRVGAVARGVAREATTEAIQSGGEKVSENRAIQQFADPSQKLMQNVGEEAIGGGLSGGLMGGVMGGIMHRNTGPSAPPQLADTGPLSRSANIALAINAGDVLGAVAGESRTEAAPVSAAEKALYTPKDMTALDRVSAIDRQLDELQRSAVAVGEDGQAPVLAPEQQIALSSLQDERDALTQDWPAAVLGTTTSFSTESGAQQDAPVRSYPKGQATALAARLTKNGLPSKAIPHPTVTGSFAIVPSDYAEPKAESTNKESLPVEPATTNKVGDLVKLTKPGVGGRVNIAGTIKKILPGGRLEVKTQNDGYMIVHESEIVRTPSNEPLTTEPKQAIAPKAISIVKAKAASPIMRRNDIVGAVMRVTGGDGVSSDMAMTITGDTPNNSKRLRGLFTNRGQQDLDDLALRLREEEGYAVTDGNHLAELLRSAAAGEHIVSMQRSEEDKQNEIEAQHREEVKKRARDYGIRIVARKFDDIEKDVLSHEMKDVAIAEEEAKLEREAIQRVSELSDSTINSLAQIAAREDEGRYINGQWISDEEIINAYEPIGEGEIEQSAARSGEIVTGEAGGNNSERSQEARPGLELYGQTLAEVRAQESQRKADEEAKTKAEKDNPPAVKADQVDLFNTQGGLFNSNRDVTPKEAPKASSEPAAQEAPADKVEPVSGKMAEDKPAPSPKKPAAEQDSQTPNDGIAYNVSDSQNIWYSALSRFIDNAQVKSAPAIGWKQQIKGALAKGSIKPAEVEAVGINDWLDLQQGKVSKEQVQAFLEQNGVQVQDVVLGGGVPQWITDKLDAYDARIGAGEKLAPGEVAEYKALEKQDEAAYRESEKPKFASYQLPGGGNYRELLLTLPGKESTQYFIAYKGDSTMGTGFATRAEAEAELADTFPGRVDLEVRAGTGDRSTTTRTPDNFRSSHFDQPNILAHVRFNDRIDADGKRVLFLEEFQSDWAQKGRKEGFAEEVPIAVRKSVDPEADEDTYEIMRGQTVIGYTHSPTEQLALENAKSRFAGSALSKGVPSAPFVTKTEAWTALALKRMIRYAAENGFDKVAWTTGEQQAGRYDLSKQVDRVEYWPDQKILTAWKDGIIVIQKALVDKSDLPEIIGKELAQKIINAPEINGALQLRGDDIRIGGEGMKSFYDKIIPNVANDVLKKIGEGKVDAVVLPAKERGNGNGWGNTNEDVTGIKESAQLGFTITPKMRETVMAGQPLFSNQSQKNLSLADKAIYGMVSEGKTAAEVLKFIAANSRNPFYRHLARLLMKTGINPTLTLGEEKGWTFNAGEGKYAAAYNPKTDTVALFRPASSERNVLHELMHAATMKALEKKGLSSVQMQKLYEHVTSIMGTEGHYGLKNLDEFIAESFTNPKFQAELKKISAPKFTTGLASAWDYFVRIVKGILRLKNNDNALSAALDIGVGVMRENMKLNDAGYSSDGRLQSAHALSNKSPITRTIDGAELQALRRAAAGIEHPEKGIFLRVESDGRAIATGPKGSRIPETFRRFAHENGLAFFAERRIPKAPAEGESMASANTPGGITDKSAPMPIPYRESGAIYFGEGKGAAIDRTDKTSFSQSVDSSENIITPSGGIALRDLKAVRDRVAKELTNLPPVHVLENPSQAPESLREHINKAGAWADVEGALHEGEIYLFASGLSNEERAEFVLATHEITHYGLRGKYGMGLDAVLQNIWLRNGRVRKAAAAAREKRGLSSNLAAVEEVLADMPSADLVRLQGWRKLVGAVRDWFAGHGFDRLAEKLNRLMSAGMSDQQKADFYVADVLRQARGWVKHGKGSAARQANASVLSRAEPQKTADQRADDILAKRSRTARPVDAVFKAVTQAARIDRVTTALYNKAGALLDRYTPEQIKAGFIADYGIPEAVTDRRVMMQGRMKQHVRSAGALIDKLGTLTRAESRVAYEWMNNADPQASAHFEAQLPPESVKIMEEVKAMVDALSQEAVKLGQLDPEVFKRNRFEYLRRSYVKHTAELTGGEAKARGRAIAILGDQYKGRGLVDAVSMAKIKNVAPEWWGRKLQNGKADTHLKGERFIRLERRAPNGEGNLELENKHGPGELNPLKKGKLRELAYWPAGEPMPPKFSAWEQAGTWEVRDTKGNDLVLWRDFSKQERQAMGEIDEARYAIAKTLHGMIHDVETGRYLEWLAQRYAAKDASQVTGKLVDASDRMRDVFTPDEWVQVPETKISGTSVHKYGLLAGRYLPGPIWNDVRQTVGGSFKPFGETYAEILKAWKMSKTALSPAVHTNNVMANFVMADWHDVTAGHVHKALKLLLAANDRDGKGILGRTGNLAARAGIADREAAKVILNRFEDSGGNIGTWATAELQKEQIAPLLEALEKELGTLGQTQPAQVGVMVALQHLLHARFPSAWAAFKPTRTGKALVTEAKNMLELYEAEDQVFRVAAWLRAKEEGASDIEAGKLARKSFLDYNINAPWVQAMRKSIFPFISFTYRAVPMLAETMAKKPWKLMKLAALAGGLNMLGYLLSGGDEDKERKLLPEEKAGRVFGLVPKLLRMPWNDANNDPVFLDVRRFVPVGDIFDTGAGHSAVPMLPAMVPGGPAAVIAEILLNRAQFTGREIVMETDTPAEQAGKVMDHLYKAFAPNIPVLPGTYSWTNIVNAGKGRTDAFGREQSVAQAAASSVGVKLGSYPADVMRLNAQRELQYRTMEIDRNISRLKREMQKHGIDRDEYASEVRDQVGKKQKLFEEFRQRTSD